MTLTLQQATLSLIDHPYFGSATLREILSQRRKSRGGAALYNSNHDTVGDI